MVMDGLTAGGKPFQEQKCAPAMHLTRAWVDSRLHSISSIPEEWELTKGHYYHLDLRMCQLRQLRYDFDWEQRPQQRVAETDPEICPPSRVVALNMSLNELESLDHNALSITSQLRRLDASLNAISRCAGVEMLTELRHLNLSYNNLSLLPSLERCCHLLEMNLAVNQLTGVATLPPLSSLTILHLNDNKLASLKGIQALSNLKELYVQNNVLISLLELTSNFQLEVLNAADNRLRTLPSILQVLQGSRNLRTLVLKGNPVCQEVGYQDLLTTSTSIITLDNVAVRPSRPTNDEQAASAFTQVKESVRRTFLERLSQQRRKADDTIRYLQSRIREVQRDYEEYEKKTWRDLESCTSYLETIPLAELRDGDLSNLRTQLPSLQGLDMAELVLPVAPPPAANNPDTPTTDTDEVLRRACQKLVEEKGRLQKSNR